MDLERLGGRAVGRYLFVPVTERVSECVYVCVCGAGGPRSASQSPYPEAGPGRPAPGERAGGCELLLPALPRFLFHVSNKVGQGHTTPGLSQDDWVFNGRKGLALRPIRLSACHVRALRFLDACGGGTWAFAG